MKVIEQPDALPTNVYRIAGGGFEIKVKVGSGATAFRNPYTFYPAGTPVGVLAHAVAAIRADLQKQRAAAPPPDVNSLAAKARLFLDAATGLTEANRKRLDHQLAFWCAQPAAAAAPVVTPDVYFDARRAFAERGVPMPALGRTLGELALVRLHLTAKGTPVIAASLSSDALDRIRTVLDTAFAPTDPDGNPTEFASTSNHYRGALRALFTWLNRNIAGAPNPVSLIATRETETSALSGQHMRIVAEVLKYATTKFGRRDRRGELRLAVLAWVNITPKQLSQLKPEHFHDVADATREDMIAGAVTLLKPARHKGRSKSIPRPELIPLTPYGVEAMRAFAAADAWGTFSTASLNKQFRRAVGRTVAALADRGVVIPGLAAMTMYHLKHSLASALSEATAGRFDRSGRLQQAEEVIEQHNHKRGRTTAIYTASSVRPILLKANVALTAFLDAALAEPLAAPLRLVGKADEVGR